MNYWLRTDETEEAISALEMLAETAPSLIADIYRWKWVIISAHNALQGFMVIALRQGNGLLALKDNIAAQWLRANREGGEYPVEKLDNFLNLYKKVKSDRMLCYGHSKKYVATPDHNRSVKKLNELRNEFIHFVPKGWSLEVTGLPEICLNCLEVIEFLAWESGNITLYEENQQERVRSAVKNTRKVLTDITTKYEESANNSFESDA
jgi:hypothetical protein